jgi:hypothetical protein
VALGSLSINALLKGKVSARYSPASVLVMAVFVVAFEQVCARFTPLPDGQLMSVRDFMVHPLTPWLLPRWGHCGGGRHVRGAALCLSHHLRRKIADGAHHCCQQCRQFGRDGGGALIAVGLGAGGEIIQQLLLASAMCLVSAWLGLLLYRAECAIGGPQTSQGGPPPLH